MTRIEFADVMSFYPKHNDAVYEMIVASQQAGSLIPFVGAGMSAFCGYKLWGAVLSDLAEFIYIEEDRQKALKQIHNGAYEEAAQTILDAYPAMLDQLPGMISPNKLKACSQEKLQSSAAFVLPYLFQTGLVITTNFDRVLETVYLNCSGKSIERVTPKQQDRLAQLRQNQSLGLFKLHGDIGNGVVSIDDLVFTGKQYAEKYADGSSLVQELTRWFENRRLLFLGCSLNIDRTMQVLKSVTKDQPGIRHYAILGCKESDIKERLKELNNLGILPIFYDDSNHDAVRVILERLLEDTDQESYKNLQVVSRIAPAAIKEERRLLFDADYFPFTGRKKELKLLEAFCASDDSISWWAVTGPGGMGKSRLVYEFANQKRKDNWQIVRFEAHPSKGSNATSMEFLDEWLPSTSRTLVVLDDVQAHMERICHWLNIVVRRPRSQKLRILLLEREGKDLNSTTWLGAESCDDIPYEWCHEEDFLCLEPMRDEDIISIMNDFATAAGKSLNAESLLKTLERVDPELKRPLYAIAIADAYCQGKNPTNWDQKKVLDTLLERELDFHLNRFRGMTGAKVTKAIRAEFMELLARSCIHGFLPLDDVQLECYPRLFRKMNDMDMDVQEFLEGLGLLRTVMLSSIRINKFGKPIGKSSEKEQKIITLSCPDLIKEHLILNLVLEGNNSSLMFPTDWEKDPGRLAFLGQLLADYGDRLKEQTKCWKPFFEATPRDILTARIYGRILWLYIAKYYDDASVAIERLAQLYDEMKCAPEIAIEYAKGLVNLSFHQDLAECMETIAHLKRLNKNHSDIPEIAVEFAKGLVNLTAKQELMGRVETIAQLEEVYQNHPDTPEIVIRLAKGLFNLTVDQDLTAISATVVRLEELYKNHSDIPEIAIEYAQGLTNLSFQQDLTGNAETVTRLDKLYQNHFDIPEVVIGYAKGLVNLAVDQDLAGCSKTVTQLDELCQSNPEIPQLVRCCARGFALLTVKQGAEECMETVTRLNKLYQSHLDIPEIAVAYAEVLVNLTVDQDLARCTETVARLNKLYQCHLNIPEIVVAYAKGLVNLTVDQDLAGCTETVARLNKLYQIHLNIPEIAVAYAKGLVNLTVDQDLAGCTETVAQLDELYQNNPDIPSIAVQFASGLSHLACCQDLEGCSESVTRLDKLYQNHPDWENVAEKYAHLLVNFSFYQENEADVYATLARSSMILNRYSENSSIRLCHAKTWFNLTLKQQAADIPATVTNIIAFLNTNADIIPSFKVALADYLADHPDHVARYKLFQTL